MGFMTKNIWLFVKLVCRVKNMTFHVVPKPPENILLEIINDWFPELDSIIQVLMFPSEFKAKKNAITNLQNVFMDIFTRSITWFWQNSWYYIAALFQKLLYDINGQQYFFYIKNIVWSENSRRRWSSYWISHYSMIQRSKSPPIELYVEENQIKFLYERLVKCGKSLKENLSSWLELLGNMRKSIKRSFQLFAVFNSFASDKNL